MTTERQMSYTALWKVPDDLWVVLERILPPEELAGTLGRPCVPFRRVFNGILYVLRSVCQWKAVPREFGSGSTVHRRFQEWVSQGVFQQTWQVLLGRYDELVGIDWEWQAVDTKMFPASLGG
jgi:transposase